MDLIRQLLDTLLAGDSRKVSRALVVLVVIILLSPILADYFLGPSRLKTKVDILEQLTRIDPNSLVDPVTLGLYRSISRDIDRIDSLFASGDGEDTVLLSRENYLKFFSGAALPLLMVIVIPFAKYDRFRRRIFAFLVLLVIAACLGTLGVLLPTFNPILINVLGFPTIQIILLAGVASRTRRPQ